MSDTTEKHFGGATWRKVDGEFLRIPDSTLCDDDGELWDDIALSDIAAE